MLSVLVRRLRALVTIPIVTILLGCTDAPQAASPAPADGRYTLRLNPQPGVVYRTVSDFHLKMDANGEQVEARRGASVSYGLEDQQAGNLALKATYDQIRCVDQRCRYDSAVVSRTRNPDERLYESQLGQSLVLTISPEGTIHRVDGTWPLAERMLRASGRDVDAERDGLNASLQSELDEQFVHYPVMPVAVGDTWQGNHRSGELFIESTYTLVAVDAGLARIEFRGTITQDGNRVGAQSGQFALDLATGWIRHGTIRNQVSSNQGAVSGGSVTWLAGGEGDVDYGRLRACVGGKYSGLLKVLDVPNDQQTYGFFSDYGRYASPTYSGYRDLPEAYWVYVAPKWYLWEEQIEPMPAAVP